MMDPISHDLFPPPPKPRGTKTGVYAMWDMCTFPPPLEPRGTKILLTGGATGILFPPPPKPRGTKTASRQLHDLT